MMDAARRREMIARYRAGTEALEAAARGLSDAELDARPSPDEWTSREVVHHCADSEMTSAIRLRRLLAEENPTIAGYDERAFAERLHYDRPIAASLAAARAARESSAELLEQLSDAEWTRTGTHTESGPYSVERWLEIYVAHAHDHAAQIERAVGAHRASR